MLSQKTFFTVTTVIFSVITVLHAARLVHGWSIVIAGWTVPYWFSFVGVIVAGCLAHSAYKLGKKAKK